MRHRVLLFAAPVLLLSAAACGPTLVRYNTALQERDAAVKERDKLAKQVDQLKKENDELRNGPRRQLELIRAAFEDGRYDDVLTSYESLHAERPGSPETEKAAALAHQAKAALAARKAKAAAAAARVAAEARKSARDKARAIIRVASVSTSEPNSAGGVDLHIKWQNRSAKTAKYVRFTVEAFNAVGDPESCSITGESEYTGRCTGPFRTGAWEGENRYWECAWYNSTVVRARLRRIDIEYMDGSTVELEGADVDYVQW